MTARAESDAERLITYPFTLRRHEMSAPNLQNNRYYEVETTFKTREVWQWHQSGETIGWYRPGDEELCPPSWARAIRQIRLGRI